MLITSHLIINQMSLMCPKFVYSHVNHKSNSFRETGLEGEISVSPII